MSRTPFVVAMAAALAAGGAGILVAQPAQPAQTGPQVGQPGPDFGLSGATRYGLLKDQVKLSDFKGQTVVLAFFYKARTRG
jgi:peroxiredoxin Q/BCP